MDTRTLWVAGLVLGAVAFWTYRDHRAPVGTNPLTGLQIDYSARDIRLLQTNPQGGLEAKTTAQALYHYPTPEQTRLDGLVSRWHDATGLRAQLSATQAWADQDYHTIRLTGQVQVAQPARGHGTATVIHTSELVGHLPAQVIETQKPVRLQSGTTHMQASGLSANLRTGDYQLTAPRITHVPSP